MNTHTSSVQGENEDSQGSNHYRMDDATLNAKINDIMNKKKLGLELTLRETKSLARLNRVRASRKYRAKEKMEKKMKSK